jgi:BirA family biotin operon repressor/biotin-[acetyl-CoA-carboxylase] ligase
MSDALPRDIAAALEAAAPRRGTLGTPAYYFSEIGSTNDAASSLAEHGAAEGTLVLASSQTAGRGRLGRQWHSPLDAGLYVSIVIRDASAVPLLTLAGGVAVAQGITRATGLPVQIKWPNDIVVPEGATPSRWRKLAGILAEASAGADGVAYVILGCGINVRQAAYPAEIATRATSIEAELGRGVERGAILAETLAALNSQLANLREGLPDRVLGDWRALAPSCRTGTVEFDGASGRVQGRAAGIDDTGALLVRVGGRVERVIAGEVVWK